MGSKKQLTAKNGARSSLTSSQSFTNQTCQNQVSASRSSNSLRRQSGDRNNNENASKLTATGSDQHKKPFQSPSILVTEVKTDNSGNGNSTLVHSSLQEIDHKVVQSNIQSNSQSVNESSASTSHTNNNQTTSNAPPSNRLNSTNKTKSSLNLYKLFSSFTNAGQTETATGTSRPTTGRSASVSVSSIDKNGQSGTQLIILDGKNVRRASSNIISNAASNSNPTISKSVRSPSAGDCSNVQHVGLTSSSTLTSPLNSTANSLSAVHPGNVRRKSREYIRRASQVLINLTAPSSNSDNNQYGECSRRDSRIVPQITLFHCCLQKLPMKDFGAEIRATMDVDQFLQQAVLLLDVNETSIEGIVNRMVGKVCKKHARFSIPI